MINEEYIGILPDRVRRQHKPPLHAALDGLHLKIVSAVESLRRELPVELPVQRLREAGCREKDAMDVNEILVIENSGDGGRHFLLGAWWRAAQGFEQGVERFIKL